MQLYPSFENDTEFIEALLAQQSVFCLPGKCFGVQNLMRIVLTLPPELTHQAMDRLELFCREHLRPSVVSSDVAVVEQMTTTDLQNKENAITGSGVKVPFKKISSAGLNAMLSSNLANLLSNDPEEAEMLMQAYQK
jgi:hypothetical protein